MGRSRRAIELLAGSGVRLMLVDVGASLEPFPAFQPLLGHATYVGFDPDLREVHDSGASGDGPGRRVMVDKAVVADAGTGTVRFFLTHNPTCSSTLPPDTGELAHWLHAHRFAVVDTAEVAATT